MKLPTEIVNGIEVQPVVDDKAWDCENCVFLPIDECLKTNNSCLKEERKDNNDVYFIKVE